GTMTMTKKIPIHEATPAQLRYYADTILGLADISPRHSTATLIAKINEANPDTLEIDVVDGVRDHPEPTGRTAGLDDEDEGVPPNGLSLHYRDDPRVKITFARAGGDVTKPKMVQISVNGDTMVAERGKQ